MSKGKKKEEEEKKKKERKLAKVQLQKTFFATRKLKSLLLFV